MLREGNSKISARVESTESSRPRLNERQERVNGAESNAGVAPVLVAPREIISARLAAATPPLKPRRTLSKRRGNMTRDTT